MIRRRGYPQRKHSRLQLFFVWLVKVVIFRVGGVALYRTVLPLVIGMIVAYATGVFISFVVDLIWFPANGHQIDLFSSPLFF
ncbi:MAG: hypothetical protein QGI34_22140 [Candidatus Latescibacteria bacterium]|nr:hypothetical protein [Candidatus Latescibacterota bacterium]